MNCRPKSILHFRYLTKYLVSNEESSTIISTTRRDTTNIKFGHNLGKPDIVDMLSMSTTCRAC